MKIKRVEIVLTRPFEGLIAFANVTLEVGKIFQKYLRRINMASQKQIIANQRNALKSKGPCTEKGKAIVSQNARTHGILCQEIPIDEYENVSFDDLVRDYL